MRKKDFNQVAKGIVDIATGGHVREPMKWNIEWDASPAEMLEKFKSIKKDFVGKEQKSVSTYDVKPSAIHSVFDKTN